MIAVTETTTASRPQDHLGRRIRDAGQGWWLATAHVRTGERDAPLAGLSGSTLVERFRTWRGRSGRRYVFSVFQLHEGLDRVPVGADAVVAAVIRTADGTRRLLWVDETGDDPHAFLRMERVRALAERADGELHLHLLAAAPAERRAVLDDLAEG